MDASKTCFKCNRTLPMTEFYVHPQMADGHLGKCKECARADANNNREKKAQYYLEYDKMRFRRPERKAQILQTAHRRRRRHPEKAHAYCVVGWARKNGKLVKQPCEVCGSPNTQAHHDDYSKPLDVRWLCFVHHRIAHGQKHFSEAS